MIEADNPPEEVADLSVDFSAMQGYFELSETVVKFPPLLPGTKAKKYVRVKPLLIGEFDFPVVISLPSGPQATRNFRVKVEEKEMAPAEKPAAKPPVPLADSGDYEGLYELVDVVPFRRGGFADIFRARDKESGEIVAIKMPRFSGTLDRKIMEDFLGEADKWSRLKHPHILRVRRLGSRPFPWIAMELADGGSLREKLRERKLQVREAVDIAEKLCDALHYAHNHGVVHLDIKPENILFASNEPGLSDWGTAKSLLYEQVTRSHFTPAYASPEHLDPAYGDPDWQTDIYQLGAVLYEMLTGRPPFLSDIPAVLLREILEKPPQKPRQLNPEVPPALEEVVLRALAKKKMERYEAALLLRKDLTPFIAPS